MEKFLCSDSESDTYTFLRRTGCSRSDWDAYQKMKNQKFAKKLKGYVGL